MRISPDLLSTTIAELYSGVGNADAFRAALQRIRTLFGAARATLVTRLGDHECFYYEDRRGGESACADAWASAVARNDRDTPPIPLDAWNVCSGCLTSLRASRLCCCVADRRGDTGFPSIHLGVHREAGSPPFDESDRRALERLGPHVLQAVHLSRRIDIAETACSMGRQVLDEVRRGVVVLNSRKEVVFMNSRAEAICGSARGVTVSKQPSGSRMLKATSAAEDQRLQRALDGAPGRESPAGRDAPSSDAVRIGCSGAGRPLLIRVAQLPALSASGAHARTVLFIDDLDARELGDDRLLMALFGLTRAEARIAGALLAGERPKAIARRFAVSEDTVRTQLRAVYAKTETHGLASLLTLLSRLADVPVLDVCESVSRRNATALSSARYAGRSSQSNPKTIAL